MMRVKARLRAASERYPSSVASLAAVMSCSLSLDAAMFIRQRVM